MRHGGGIRTHSYWKATVRYGSDGKNLPSDDDDHDPPLKCTSTVEDAIIINIEEIGQIEL